MILTKEKIGILKELRSLLYQIKPEEFDMGVFLEDVNTRKKCGCVGGYLYWFILNQDLDDCALFFNSHPFKGIAYVFDTGWDIKTPLVEFIFSKEWKYFDNTVEGAIGRLSAVIDGLRF